MPRTMLRCALVSFTTTHHGRAQIVNPSHPPPQALLPQWRCYASIASSSLAPPQPPPPSPLGDPSRPGGGGPRVLSLNPAEVAKFAVITETW
ncbi:ubiquinone biosynthesis O-methyltransferase, mitochondrial-like isoform X2 [Panicum miliaceum]|uniref:Ubiquinone biosynthesis O-methyltransferase, mitochondrial-like isoform X2 n=1 Tax=Panicum miliaceum TaxID=4540 RepID=A0A3L6S9Z9_PANMI|nr:ubiquinone biosynthesis O-methyltransferase, mitochondrial-like isoform X2 [Panicum miliaceum]